MLTVHYEQELLQHYLMTVQPARCGWHRAGTDG